jgi:hypothetical protein
METNYFNAMMDTTYKLVTDKSVDWPDEMTSSNQKRLIDKMIEYYSNTEDFEKCIILRQKLQCIDAEINEI